MLSCCKCWGLPIPQSASGQAIFRQPPRRSALYGPASAGVLTTVTIARHTEAQVCDAYHAAFYVRPTILMNQLAQGQLQSGHGQSQPASSRSGPKRLLCTM